MEDKIFSNQVGYIITIASPSIQIHSMFCRHCYSISDFQLKLVSCRVKNEISSTIEILPSIYCTFSNNTSPIPSIIATTNNRRILPCFQDVDEYIILKKDFIKARTYSPEVANLLKQLWLNSSKEQALEEANKQQQDLNERIKKENENLIKIIFEDCQREHLLNLFCKGNEERKRFLKSGKGLKKREKLLKDWKQVILPKTTIEAITKQLKTANFDHEADLFQIRANKSI